MTLTNKTPASEGAPSRRSSAQKKTQQEQQIKKRQKQHEKNDPLTLISRRITVLRISFLVCLFAAAVICGSVAYMRISKLEQNVGIQTYESVSASALRNAQALAQQRMEGGKTMASILKYAFPNASQWPFVALEGYVETANQIAQQSSTLTQALNVIVQPSQVEAFEEWAYQTYRDQNYPETAGVSQDANGDDFFGIYAMDPDTGTRIHATAGETSYNSPNDILVPIFQHNNVNASSILFDVHSRELQGKVVDSMLECSQQAETDADDTKTTTTSPNCGVVTKFMELIIRPGPAALIYTPLYPANDPFTQVGVMGTTLHWEEVLTNIVPSHVNLLAVISSNERDPTSDDDDKNKDEMIKSYTFEIRNGVPQLVGEGTLLGDSKLESYGRSAYLTASLESGGASASSIYRLTVYPANASFEEYKTNSPLAVSLGFIGVILFCTVVFFLYDWFVQSESHQRKAILQVKRQFVRFISHEIRTPLNTVSMGLELLQADMKRYLQHRNDPFNRKEKLSEWVDLTKDVVENSSDAILVLNDLLNYDKIENGTLQLYLSELQMNQFTERVVSQLDMEAKNRQVALSFEFVDEFAENTSGGKASKSIVDVDKSNERDIETGDLNKEAEGERIYDAERLRVFADENRIRQVVRNVLSNALKFTPENGTVDVSVIYSPDNDLCVNTTNSTLVEDHIKTTHTGEGQECPRAGTCIIRVKDSGAGMTAEQLGRLFGEGVQFDANKLQAGGGSGLGLWISKGIAESHGGSIMAESEGRQKGSTFQITLPLYKPPKVEGPLGGTVSTHNMSEGSDEELSSTDEAPPKKRHILVVDDALLNRKMLTRLLERSGHTCEAACDGDEAVAIIAAELEKDNNQQSIGCILMDSEMPRLQGPDAAAQIRELGFQGLIVGITGNVLPEDITHFKSMGANAVLAKPVRLPHLEDVWTRWDKKASKEQ